MKKISKATKTFLIHLFTSLGWGLLYGFLFYVGSEFTKAYVVGLVVFTTRLAIKLEKETRDAEWNTSSEVNRAILEMMEGQLNDRLSRERGRLLVRDDDEDNLYVGED